MSTSMAVVLVLNFKGKALLEALLPSIVTAAHSDRGDCPVIVVDTNPAFQCERGQQHDQQHAGRDQCLGGQQRRRPCEFKPEPTVF